MDVKQLKIADLNEDPANVRKHSERNIEAIKGSLRAFGQQKPIVVDGNGVVVAGNGTLAAARALGWETVAAVRTGLKGAERIAYAIADNRTAELAEWDDDALGKALHALSADSAIDEACTGFDADEIARKLMADTGGASVNEPTDTTYEVVVSCEDESDQQSVYERLTKEGLQCRVLTF